MQRKKKITDGTSPLKVLQRRKVIDKTLEYMRRERYVIVKQIHKLKCARWQRLLEANGNAVLCIFTGD